MSANPTDTPSSDLFGPPPERVRVLLPLPLAEPYDYAVPPETALEPGAIVEVPLGRRRLHGVVLGPADDSVPSDKLKAVIRRFPVDPLPGSVLELVAWTASWTLSPAGSVARLAMSVPAAFEPPKPIRAFARNPVPPDASIRLTPARRRVLDLLEDGPPRTTTEIAVEAAVGAGVVKGMVEAGLLITVDLPAEPRVPRPDPEHPGPALTPDQSAAASVLRDAVAEAGFGVTLLDGVTGSGKTEVYFEAVAEALRRGRQALVLVPEIALSTPWLARFEARFGTTPAVWHSEIGLPRRRAVWRAVSEGRARVVVGARSALFLPFRELGAIVVDEEHDAAYKQDDGVSYHGRDMAVVRARLEDIPIVLASATPSLETWTNVNQGRYRRLALPSRFGAARMPDIELVDLRRDRPDRGRWLSEPLARAVHATVERGEQALLFLNRRGYAPLTLCRACGHRIECPSCSAWLVEHRLAGRLQCHHCGFSTRPPKGCPSCGAEDSLVPSGPGIERVAEEVYERFPDARVQTVSSDTLTGPAAAAEFVRAMAEGEIDILVGTQIVAKGHHFPGLTTVGVVDADLGLAGGDLRAGERTFQLLQQVAGRAGRSEKPGRVLLQTHQPDDPLMRAIASGDRDGFLEREAEGRRASGMPPFGRLAALVISAKDMGQADGVARALARSAPRLEGVDILGPAPAPLALLRGRHRRRLLLKAERRVNVQAILRDWLGRVSIPGTVRLGVDIDPYNFM